MKIKTLRSKNPEYNADRWAELEALAKGGELFHDKIREFLPQNAVEPNDMYSKRVAQAHYHSYMGSIVNHYVSWLFASGFKVSSDGSADPFYTDFHDDVGADVSLPDFMRERFRQANTTMCSHWLIQLPSDDGAKPADKSEYEKRGLGRASLQNVDPADLLDWELDENGQYKWAVIYSYDLVRRSFAEERDWVIETWRYYDDVAVTTYKSEYRKREKPSDTTEITPEGAAQEHGFKRVPIMTLRVPNELCLGEQTRDPQLEHFRVDNALSWLIRRCCYSQPVFYLEDGDTTLPTMGAGYAISLGAQDKFGWTTPPSTPFDILQKNVDAKRDQIYRVTHSMAQGVDNNAETVGRSADSKEIDAASTRILLNAYGELVGKAIKKTYEAISEARGEDVRWSVEGFSGYDTATVAGLIADATASRLLGIPSETFQRKITTRVALALCAGEDSAVKEAIREEIRKAEFKVGSEVTMPAPAIEDAKADSLTAKAELDRAKASAEPIKAAAAVKSASRPAPKPGRPGQ